MAMKHTHENIYYARQTILNVSKAYGVYALDIVCINLNNDTDFLSEAKLVFDMGFDGKFLIHPKQIDLLSEVEYFSESEILEAESVYDSIQNIIDQKSSVVKVNGRIYEKPHVKRIVDIINWKSNKYGSK